MARKQHTYHFIYKTINQVNGKWYIGMHSTSNLEDGYIGSGKRLWYSIRKYGRENFKMEIQEFLPDRRSLKDKEKEIVNEGLLQDPMCMNLAIVGEGGFINREAAIAGGKSKGRDLSKCQIACLNYEKLTNTDIESVRVNDQYRIEFKTSIVGENPNSFTICSIFKLSNHYK